MGVFEKHQETVFPHRFNVELLIRDIAGSIPKEPDVIKKWIESKFGDNDALVVEMVANTMQEMGIEDATAAIEKVAATASVTGFRRDEQGLFIRDYMVKACIKEAANVAWPEKRWGKTYKNPKGEQKDAPKKGTRSFMPEHIFVSPDRIYLGCNEPSRVDQRFVHSWRGAAIHRPEVVEEAKVGFTLATDWQFTEAQWAEVWLRAERLGIGATRSQGYGLFEVTVWDKV